MPYTTISRVLLYNYCILPLLPTLLRVPSLEKKSNLPRRTTSLKHPPLYLHHPAGHLLCLAPLAASALLLHCENPPGWAISDSSFECQWPPLSCQDSHDSTQDPNPETLTPSQSTFDRDPVMFPSSVIDFDYPRAPSGCRLGCQSASVSVEQDLQESWCLAGASVLPKRYHYCPRTILSTPAGYYTVYRASVQSSHEGLL